MKRLLKHAVAAGLLIGATLGGTAQQRVQEQRSFGAEDKAFQRPFPLPGSILDVLSVQDEVKDALDNADIPSNKLPSSWFLASQIHLAGPSEADVVIMGRCPVCGANVVPFWIFRPSGKSYELIMAGGGLGLDVLSHRRNGYLDIETALVAQQKPWTSLWRFNGMKYELVPKNNHN